MASLTPKQREELWKQFVEEHAKAQEAFDSSVLKLGAGGVAVTVSLATALETLGWSGGTAVVLFLACLGAAVLSYVFVQLDMRARLAALRAKTDYEGAERTGWTTATWLCNVGAGVLLLAGAVFLAIFIATTI